MCGITQKSRKLEGAWGNSTSLKYFLVIFLFIIADVWGTTYILGCLNIICWTCGPNFPPVWFQVLCQYDNKDLKKFFVDDNIECEPSVPYTPQLNGTPVEGSREKIEPSLTRLDHDAFERCSSDVRRFLWDRFYWLWVSQNLTMV